MNPPRKPGNRAALVCLSLLSVYIFYVAALVPPAQGPVPLSECELVVLAHPDDPYYPLAQEISLSEDALLVNDLVKASACHPEFLLWVVSPGFLSDKGMIETGQAMKGQPTAVSLGILSASTLEQTRSLWLRRKDVQSEQVFSVNAANPAAHIDAGRISHHSEAQTTRLPLTKENFKSALLNADYLTFTGHGSNSYLRLDENTTIKPADVPALGALVISTGSCQTFRLWNEDSIARRFADQGAAAYAGFVYSPNEGYLIGEFDGLPMRNTWPAFPIGHVVQVQNRGTLQGFASFPYQFLLGDPRIALQAEPAYHLVSDRQVGGWRVLTYQDVPSGAALIRIPGGAEYGYIEAVGITTAAEQDPFYNSRLQMADIQNDKLIIVVQMGGDLTLRARVRPPLHWFLSDILLDSLDHTLLFSQQTGGDLIALVPAGLSLVWVGWLAFKKRLAWQTTRLALAIGVGAVLLQTGYVLARLELVTITSKLVVFSPLSLLVSLWLSVCAGLIYLHSRGWRGRLAALLLATFNSWGTGLFGLLAVAALNYLGYLPAYGSSIYNYSLGLITVGTLLLTLAYFLPLLIWARQVIDLGSKMPVDQPVLE